MTRTPDRLLLLGYDLGQAEPRKALAQISQDEDKHTEQLRLVATLYGKTVQECRAAGLDVTEGIPDKHRLQYMMHDCMVFSDYQSTEPSTSVITTH